MKRYIFSILFIIFLSITIFSCKKDLIPEKKEIVGLVEMIESPWHGSVRSAYSLYRPEWAKGEVYYLGHVYTNGQLILWEYIFDDVYEKPDMSEYIGRIIRVKGYITNGYLGGIEPYILKPEVIEVKDIDYCKIIEDYANPDSYIWK